MTADQIQSIARRIANSLWTRYWLNWSDSEHPIMAIQCIDSSGKPQKIQDAESHGLKENEDYIYTVQRTNEDGTRYVRKLV